jgi:hypothetical protein
LFERVISTDERLELELFVGDWGEHPEGAMASSAVVERLDVLEHRRLQFGPRGPGAAVDELRIQGREQRLGDRVRLRCRLRLIGWLRSGLSV